MPDLDAMWQAYAAGEIDADDVMECILAYLAANPDKASEVYTALAQ